MPEQSDDQDGLRN